MDRREYRQLKTNRDVIIKACDERENLGVKYWPTERGPTVFNIEKGVPRSGVRDSYVQNDLASPEWKEMEVGDSFLLDREDYDTARKVQYLMSGMVSRIPDRKYSYRNTKDGFRVWRIE